ncbi:MAG: hypothetical protein IH934_04065 [Nanoarchaeota archaeon]|nr:hypothetical protein [Nanoarchaeota archaeon]
MPPNNRLWIPSQELGNVSEKVTLERIIEAIDGRLHTTLVTNQQVQQLFDD